MNYRTFLTVTFICLICTKRVGVFIMGASMGILIMVAWFNGGGDHAAFSSS